MNLFHFTRPDLLKDSPAKAITALAIPVILLNLFKAGYNIVDMFWIGRLGSDYLAGVNASIFLVWANHGLATLLTVGVIATISRLLGEEKVEQAKENSFYVVKYAIIIGFIVSLLLFPAINPLVNLVGMNAVATNVGKSYLYVMIGGTSLTFLMMTLNSLLIAWGDTVTPFLVYSITFVLNIILSPLLMFGVGPFPELGIQGAAVATLISYALTSSLFLWALFRNNHFSKSRNTIIIPIKNYLKIGYPLALAGLFFSLIYFFIAKVAAIFGTIPVAAMGVGHKIESIAYFFSMGFASAVATFTGRNLGAHRKDRVKIGLRFAMKTSAFAITLYSLVAILFSNQIAAVFTDDPRLIAEVSNYVRIVLVVEAFQSVLILLEDGAFSGAGYTWPSFFITMPMVLIRVPLGWLFGVHFGMGPTGIWLVIAASMFISWAIFFWLYKREKWLETKVI
ncbi:MATE family efflux transporter [bacterium]|nr:MATE family efflux transporter [bacterium]